MSDQPEVLTFAESLAACRSSHDRITFQRTNRKLPARCSDCGQAFTVADLFALLIEYLARAEDGLAARIERLEALAGIDHRAP